MYAKAKNCSMSINHKTNLFLIRERNTEIVASKLQEGKVWKILRGLVLDNLSFYPLLLSSA